MKKRLIPFLLALPLLLTPWACKRPAPTAPGILMSQTQTVTATPITTPVCGFTLISLGTRSMAAQPNVIRSQADWDTFCSYPTGMILPTPGPSPTVPPAPVDFSKQMLIIYKLGVCSSGALNFTGVCEDPGQVDVYADNVESCVNCNAGATWGFISALVVPQDPSTVVYHITDVPCTLFGGVTPTPTP